MTRPDEEITGYGGQPRTNPSVSAGASERTSTSPATEDMKNKARGAAEQAKDEGKAQLERYRGTGADELARVAQSVRAAASDLETDRPMLSRYVSSLAENMVRLADDMRDKSVDELVRDVNRLARQNPGVFIAGSVALGFGLVRFARSSGQRAASGDYGDEQGYHDEHERGDMGAHTVGDGSLPSQAELNRHLDSGQPGGSIGSVSNASADGRVGSAVPTRADPRIRSSSTAPTTVHRDSNT